jgi:hypothetical protein
MTGALTEERGIDLRRAFIVGFVIGAVVLVLAAFLSLIVELPEFLSDLLTVGTFLLNPLLEAMADWPGILNVALAAAANGLVYGVAAAIAALVVNLVRR